MKRLMVLVCALTLVAGFGPVTAAVKGPVKVPWKPTRVQVDTARKIGRPVILSNAIGMKFVLIPAGNFKMGSRSSLAAGDEHPSHRVRISRPFYLQTTEVTQDQWFAVMGNNPSYFKGHGDRPVERVSYQDALEFIRRLNRREGTTRYRLPTEAEWEYACRAGTATDYSFGDSSAGLNDYGWSNGNSYGTTHPVGKKRPNPWGLYDMHGNVWEWCSDWYAKDYYKKSPSTDPKGPASGGYRVLRGGAWYLDAGFLRSANRGGNIPSSRSRANGFRVVRDD
jgi:formylglycine-generating enzyme required for sulfatase activity